MSLLCMSRNFINENYIKIVCQLNGILIVYVYYLMQNHPHIIIFLLNTKLFYTHNCVCFRMLVLRVLLPLF